MIAVMTGRTPMRMMYRPATNHWSITTGATHHKIEPNHEGMHHNRQLSHGCIRILHVPK